MGLGSGQSTKNISKFTDVKTQKRNLMICDNGLLQPLCVTSVIEEIAADKGLKRIYKLTNVDEHQNVPFFYKDEKLTVIALKTRIDYYKNGTKTFDNLECVFPLWPSNVVRYLNNITKQRVVPDETLKRYMPKDVNIPYCCSCTIDDDDTVCCDLNTCSCALAERECYHKSSCSNTKLRDGFIEGTYVQHTGDKSFGCGVRAISSIKKGGLIGPFVGKIKVIRSSVNISKSSWSPLLVSHYGFGLPMDKFKKKAIEKEDGGRDELLVYVESCAFGFVTSIINDPGIDDSANVKLIIVESCNSMYPVIVATRDIQADEWLLLSYGESYFKNNKIQRSIFPTLTTKNLLQPQVQIPVYNNKDDENDELEDHFRRFLSESNYRLVDNESSSLLLPYNNITTTTTSEETQPPLIPTITLEPTLQIEPTVPMEPTVPFEPTVPIEPTVPTGPTIITGPTITHVHNSSTEEIVKGEEIKLSNFIPSFASSPLATSSVSIVPMPLSIQKENGDDGNNDAVDCDSDKTLPIVTKITSKNKKQEVSKQVKNIIDTPHRPILKTRSSSRRGNIETKLKLRSSSSLSLKRKLSASSTTSSSSSTDDDHDFDGIIKRRKKTLSQGKKKLNKEREEKIIKRRRKKVKDKRRVTFKQKYVDPFTTRPNYTAPVDINFPLSIERDLDAYSRVWGFLKKYKKPESEEEGEEEEEEEHEKPKDRNIDKDFFWKIDKTRKVPDKVAKKIKALNKSMKNKTSLDECSFEEQQIRILEKDWIRHIVNTVLDGLFSRPQLNGIDFASQLNESIKEVLNGYPAPIYTEIPDISKDYSFLDQKSYNEAKDLYRRKHNKALLQKKELYCPICDEDINILKDHEDRHNFMVAYRCHLCGKNCHRLGDYDNHMKKEHLNEDQNTIMTMKIRSGL